MDHENLHDTTALVVGGGPTGLTAALVLAANGIACRVIERRTAPSSSSRALGLQARSMELLAGLGVAEEVERVAYRLSGASVMRGDDELVRLPWIPPDSRYPYTYVLPQVGLEHLLRTRLGELGVEVERGAELQRLTQDDAGVVAHLADGRRLTAGWLVGADGARSRVREELGIAFPGTATGETYYLADVVLRLATPIEDSAMWLGPEGPFMLMRLPGGEGLWRIFVDVTDAARAADLPEPSAEILGDLLDERGPGGAGIERLDWTSVFHTRVCLADAYRRGRVFIAGDAAHVFPPFGGQGMNLGIQDAVNLAWRLATVARGGPQNLLDDYETERRPIAAATIRDVEARRRMYALRHPVARALRDLLLRMGGRSERAARSGARKNSQLDSGYSTGGPFAPRPRVGDRAPDGALGTGTVHERFGPDHLTLLRFRAGASPEPLTRDGAVLTVSVDDGTDPGGTLRARYGMRGDGFVLVRPDGHIAARGARPTQARLAIEALQPQ
ncbi:monooxygenase FAD-binding [Beutenbergia cavernae DSM 12333]|uniref:Monooxygenase FAD-binding n=1 Tax=Beutenbergia cavernae (strain ATCC BAA-8 / DSM 12333 / CCUG 43141 / JCM 11478 / NBRC 16432 / NCIMB 13614 / HKI 0122) TaxID=471853 RepID=C5BX05_BEUC1|nr:FAD-dependent monooxygenase [Beutenbergia cavernae]ACQ78680.1 monooxygenase FAD-binding [Beutenbergia cavernae DSM 12333]